MGTDVEQLGRLRPLERRDGDRVLAWRNMPGVRAMMYTDHVIQPAEHAAWLDRVLSAEWERHLIYENGGDPLGLVSFTRLRPEWGTAHWAFYIGAEHAPKGTGSRMEFAALSLAFGPLGLRKLSCEVIAFNGRVVALHRHFGFVEEGFFADEVYRDGRFWGVHRMALFRDVWKTVAPRQRAFLLGAGEYGTSD